jgi:hypothetical protein
MYVAHPKSVIRVLPASCARVTHASVHRSLVSISNVFDFSMERSYHMRVHDAETIASCNQMLNYVTEIRCLVNFGSSPCLGSFFPAAHVIVLFRDAHMFAL